MKRIVLLLVGLLGASFNTQAAGLYRWVDAQGKVHYGDMIPVGANQVEEKKFSATAAPGEDLPYETRRAQQNFPITLYVAANCTEYCDSARDLLNKRGIPFSEKMLRTREELDIFKALSGSENVPTLSIGKTFLKGFQADQWHSELDITGYPKTLPYRIPKMPAAPKATVSSATLPAEPPSDSAAQ